MTKNSQILTSIDVGTSKVCTIIAEAISPRDIKILGYGIVPSYGLKKGTIVNSESVQKAIHVSIKKAEQQAKVKIENAYIGVTGSHVSFENAWTTLGNTEHHDVITANDLSNDLNIGTEPAKPSFMESNRQVIHAIPMEYSIDGQKGIRNPLGMHSQDIKVDTHFVTGETSFIEKLMSSVESAGVKISGLVLEPLASSESVLKDIERELGSVVVDIGRGTTDIAVFKNNKLCFTSVIPVGGYQFTTDIASTYGTTFKTAEETKLRYAHTELHKVPKEMEVSIPLMGRNKHAQIPQRDLCQLTRERALELINLIRIKLEDAKLNDLSNTQIVLTGGASNLPGLSALTQRYLSNRVRIGKPINHTDLPEELRNPAHSTGVGILLWVTNPDSTIWINKTNGFRNYSEPVIYLAISKMFRQCKNLFKHNLLSVNQGGS